jgi:hypothetical protein
MMPVQACQEDSVKWYLLVVLFYVASVLSSGAATGGAAQAASYPMLPEHPGSELTSPPSLGFVISVTEGEHSRDSNSSTTSITLNGKQIHYGKTYAGYRASSRPKVDKDVEIKEEDLARIQKLLVENHLLRSRSSILPTGQPGRYVEIHATIESGKAKYVLKFSGMRADAEKDKLYVGLEAVLAEVEQIVNP